MTKKDELVIANKGVFKRLAISWEYMAGQVSKVLAPDLQMRICKVILKKAREIVPVDTGALRASGRIVKAPNRKDLHVRFGSGRVKYAAVVEYGRWSYNPMSPKPYMRPAVDHARLMFKGVAAISIEKGFKGFQHKIY